MRGNQVPAVNHAERLNRDTMGDQTHNRRPWRLAAMMGLVFAVQGSFWPLLSVHLSDLGIQGRARGWIFATLAIGSAIMPLGAGHLADRLIATQWFLALTYAVATCLLVVAASGVVQNAFWLFVLFLAFWSLAAPAYSLCNSLSMRNLPNPGRQFGWVRLWGTAGWMFAGWLVSIVMALSGSTEKGYGTYEAIWVATAVSAIFTIYCLTLPNTPPLAVGLKAEPPLLAFLTLARQREVAVFLATSFGVYLTVPMVYQVMPAYLEARGLPRSWVSTVMTIGQTTEIGCLAVLPWLFRRIGIKGTLSLGIVAWILRFLQLALNPPLWFAIAGTLLHGVGIACFTVGGQVFLDGQSPRHLRASAQALLLVGTSGLGALVGNVLAGELTQHFNPTDVVVFLIPCVIDVALLIYFLRGFRTPVSVGTWAGATNVDHSPPIQPGRGSVLRVGHLVTESADG
jgi:MFS family permease